MNTIELFAGTKSFSKVAEELGHQTFTIDIDKSLNPDQCADFLQLPIIDFVNETWDMCWASPPCQAFSVATIGRNWDKETGKPKSESAILGLKLIDRTIEWISEINPKIWFIENPRGMMRKIIDELFSKHGITDYKRFTVTYCQYGDTRMKPTDIWTNSDSWKPKEPCKNGDPCHVSAPRGSITGTQGIKGAKNRGVIPPKLFYEIFDACAVPGMGIKMFECENCEDEGCDECAFEELQEQEGREEIPSSQNVQEVSP